jgi:hypothetical protein
MAAILFSTSGRISHGTSCQPPLSGLRLGRSTNDGRRQTAVRDRAGRWAGEGVRRNLERLAQREGEILRTFAIITVPAGADVATLRPHAADPGGAGLARLAWRETNGDRTALLHAAPSGTPRVLARCQDREFACKQRGGFARAGLIDRTAQRNGMPGRARKRARARRAWHERLGPYLN